MKLRYSWESYYSYVENYSLHFPRTVLNYPALSYVKSPAHICSINYPKLIASIPL